jgi:hypothetical protein
MAGSLLRNRFDNEIYVAAPQSAVCGQPGHQGHLAVVADGLRIGHSGASSDA